MAGISLAATADERIYWAAADAIAQVLLEHLRSCPGVESLELAGSFRRGRETIGDLDILCVAPQAGEIMDRFAAFPDVAAILGRGDTKMSVRLAGGLQVDLRVVPAESFGAALQYFTGSKDHNVILRGIAKDRGLKINEYGVYQVSDPAAPPIAGRTEEDVYAALGLPWISPELREARREFEWAAAGKIPTLITAADLCADLHMHTNATDGKATLEEMVNAARARGLKYIAITDHSQRVSMANGLTPERALAQWSEIDRLNARLQSEGVDFLVLKGIECDILERGGMDLPDDVLAQADWVIASVHYGQNQPRAQITERILGALANPYVSIIAHPTGRLLNRRKPYEVDLDAVYAAARQHGKLLELNANPARLDLDDIYAFRALELGCLLAINTDAHQPANFDLAHFGVGIARRAWATSDKVINAWPAEKLLHWLDARGHRRANHGAPVLIEVAGPPPVEGVELEQPPRKQGPAAEAVPAAGKKKPASKSLPAAKRRPPAARKPTARPKKKAAARKR